MPRGCASVLLSADSQPQRTLHNNYLLLKKTKAYHVLKNKLREKYMVLSSKQFQL